MECCISWCSVFETALASVLAAVAGSAITLYTQWQYKRWKRAKGYFIGRLDDKKFDRKFFRKILYRKKVELEIILDEKNAASFMEIGLITSQSGEIGLMFENHQEVWFNSSSRSYKLTGKFDVHEGGFNQGHLQLILVKTEK